MEPLLTIDEVADFLKVSRRQVYLLIQDDGLPTVHVGQRLRFDPEDIRDYLDARRGAKPVGAPWLRVAK